uniref:Uncharacterized protein n=1 Tax=Ananas comosus var. bracteatus TaxID=296719 RepID=A0A6V7NH54_ANACO|nr:unnamed protein product [Ananas comosus var. bracteatus]
MGNCSPKPRSRSPPQQPTTGAAAAGDDPSPPPIVRIYGSESCPLAWRIRAALLYKGVASEFAPSESPILRGPLVLCGDGGGDAVGGSAEEMLRYVDSRFPGPPRAAAATAEEEEAAAAAVALQHRSVERQAEGMARWARGDGGGGGEEEEGAATGVVAAEGRRLGRRYGELVEVMLEHAGWRSGCSSPSWSEPPIEPVREGAMSSSEAAAGDVGGEPPKKHSKQSKGKETRITKDSASVEDRLTLLEDILSKEHCKEHFKEEERELIPLFDAANRMLREEGNTSSRWAEEVMGRWRPLIRSASSFLHGRPPSSRSCTVPGHRLQVYC